MAKIDLLVVGVQYKPFEAIVHNGCVLPNVKFLIIETKNCVLWKFFFRIFLLFRLNSLALRCKIPKENLRDFRNYTRTQSTRVLFWSPWYLSLWYCMGKLVPQNNKSLFCWAPLGIAFDIKRLRHFIKKTRRIGFEFYTMNPSDAETYQMHLTTQVYRHFDEIENSNCKSDFYFLGKTKGRETILSRLEVALEVKGFSVDFRVFADVPKEPVSFEENVAMSKGCRCLIDIVASKYGQDGMTLRPLEALFLGKKLLTNFAPIKDCDFYHPDNIFIINENDLNLNGIENFMKRPFHPVDEKILERYEVNPWLKRYFL